MKTHFNICVIAIFAVFLLGCNEHKDDPDSNEERVVIPIVNAIDLGLSVKWADANVGAASPTDFGYYYAWGETSIKKDYSWNNYKWAGGSNTSLTKYCMADSYGSTDGLSLLQPEDDMARVAYGGKWRMPSIDEWKELKENCTWTKEIVNGEFAGYTVSNEILETSIFLPAAGGWENAEVHRLGTTGFYWAADLYTPKSCYANVYFFNNGGLSCSYGTRSFGLSVRAVLAE